MTDLSLTTSQGLAPSEPRLAVAVRQATMDDLTYIDVLHKQNRNGLGYFPTEQFKGYIEMGAVLIAFCPTDYSRRLGYVISRDRYLKRDELGVIYQLCVVPGAQRKLVGATLIQAVFERSAYGCRLYCLWCAQDLAANHFWESLGFVPVAFRAGSDKRKRVHIFWQKRIVKNDSTTPYWYPSATNGGSIRADRLVFPIPPGTHWKEVQAVAVPTIEDPNAPALERAKRPRTKPKATVKPGQHDPTKGPKLVGSKQFRPPSALGPPVPTQAEPVKPVEIVKAERAPKAQAREASPIRTKIDPKFLAANRELRDRYLEQLNTLEVVGQGKYDVSRALPDKVGAGAEGAGDVGKQPLLPQAQAA